MGAKNEGNVSTDVPNASQARLAHDQIGRTWWFFLLRFTSTSSSFMAATVASSWVASAVRRWLWIRCAFGPCAASSDRFV